MKRKGLAQRCRSLPTAVGVAGILSFLAALSLGAADVLAEGTPAGTEITSQATVTYTAGAGSQTTLSNEVSVQVAQLIDVSVVWQDATPIQVLPGDSLRVLTFRVTNTGNGTDSFILQGEDAVAGDDFDPELAGLRLDANGNGIYDEPVDPWYIPGTNDPQLVPDDQVTVFVLAHIPVTPVDGDEGLCRLRAESSTGTGVPGTVLPGGGEGGVDAVVGTGGGGAAELGTYLVASLAVEILKSATVADLFGGAEPAPGSFITYSLVVSVTGSGTARDVTVTDPIPTHTTYVADSLTLDGSSLTDAIDADAGQVAAGPPGLVTVELGVLTGGSPDQTITFTVVID